MGIMPLLTFPQLSLSPTFPHGLKAARKPELAFRYHEDAKHSKLSTLLSR